MQLSDQILAQSLQAQHEQHSYSDSDDQFDGGNGVQAEVANNDSNDAAAFELQDLLDNVGFESSELDAINEH